MMSLIKILIIGLGLFVVGREWKREHILKTTKETLKESQRELDFLQTYGNDLSFSEIKCFESWSKSTLDKALLDKINEIIVKYQKD